MVHQSFLHKFIDGLNDLLHGIGIVHACWFVQVNIVQPKTAETICQVCPDVERVHTAGQCPELHTDKIFVARMLTQGVAQHNFAFASVIKLTNIEHRHSMVECRVNSADTTLFISAGHTHAAQSDSFHAIHFRIPICR